MGHFAELDYFAAAESLDFMSWDSYPTGQIDKELLPEFDPNQWARTGHPDLTSLNHDLMRGLRPGLRRWRGLGRGTRGPTAPAP